MTIKEAHSYLEDVQREMTKRYKFFSQEYIDANGIAILALEKQIPTLPIQRRSIGGTKCYVCPKCHEAVINESFCMDCGQALDWGENEDDDI